MTQTMQALVPAVQMTHTNQVRLPDPSARNLIQTAGPIKMVEVRRFELLTCSLRTNRSTN